MVANDYRVEVVKFNLFLKTKGLDSNRLNDKKKPYLMTFISLIFLTVKRVKSHL